MHTENHTLFICMCIYIWCTNPECLKEFFENRKKKSEYIKSNSWMAHFSLAPELFDKRADVTHNVRQYTEYRRFFIDYVVLLYNLNRDISDYGMVILSFTKFTTLLLFLLLNWHSFYCLSRVNIRNIRVKILLKRSSIQRGLLVIGT